ncbi:hypothetical protein PVK06_044682 [Gossypium arboreum]|uniref:Uncharacterized protein n=1 Tax=Gossypium arboreum TaxID=29729 RepID=A0ABR0MTK1_GOSAR|nr:hypothetical protein PVK06_044682 [Gossypium arboreum]
MVKEKAKPWEMARKGGGRNGKDEKDGREWKEGEALERRLPEGLIYYLSNNRASLNIFSYDWLAKKSKVAALATTNLQFISQHI